MGKYADTANKVVDNYCEEAIDGTKTMIALVDLSVEADAEIEAKDREIRTWKEISTGLRMDMDDLRAKALKLADAVEAVNDLIESSTGVVGLHLNGDIAEWESICEGGYFEAWLLPLAEATPIARELKGENG